MSWLLILILKCWREIKNWIFFSLLFPKRIDRVFCWKEKHSKLIKIYFWIQNKILRHNFLQILTPIHSISRRQTQVLYLTGRIHFRRSQSVSRQYVKFAILSNVFNFVFSSSFFDWLIPRRFFRFQSSTCSSTSWPSSATAAVDLVGSRDWHGKRLRSARNRRLHSL